MAYDYRDSRPLGLPANSSANSRRGISKMKDEQNEMKFNESTKIRFKTFSNRAIIQLQLVRTFYCKPCIPTCIGVLVLDCW